MIAELEVGIDFVHLYVPRSKDYRNLLRQMFAIRQPTADYWANWDSYTETEFTTDWLNYKYDNCSGHSWTFDSTVMAGKLRKILERYPFSDKTKQ